MIHINTLVEAHLAVWVSIKITYAPTVSWQLNWS